MLQRILNRNNLIKTNHIHLQKSNVTLCPFFKPAYFKCLEKIKRKKKKRGAFPHLQWFYSGYPAVCTEDGQGKDPCSLSHWFSGCLVFSCLGIAKVKKEDRSTVACRRLRRREAAEEPCSVSKYIQFSYNFIAGDSRNLRSSTSYGCCSQILTGSCITYLEISSLCDVHF